MKYVKVNSMNKAACVFYNDDDELIKGKKRKQNIRNIKEYGKENY